MLVSLLVVEVENTVVEIIFVLFSVTIIIGSNWWGAWAWDRYWDAAWWGTWRRRAHRHWWWCCDCNILHVLKFLGILFLKCIQR